LLVRIRSVIEKDLGKFVDDLIKYMSEPDYSSEEANRMIDEGWNKFVDQIDQGDDFSRLVFDYVQRFALEKVNEGAVSLIHNLKDSLAQIFNTFKVAISFKDEPFMGENKPRLLEGARKILSLSLQEIDKRISEI